MASHSKILISTIASLLTLLASCSESPSLERQLEDYISGCPAEIGVAVIIPNSDTIVINDGHYPMNSVLKLFQSLPTAYTMNARSISWDSVANIPAASLDHDTWSPMLKNLAGDTISITYGQLLDYALAQSDNNACDILFRNVVGIDSTALFWRERGLDDFQIKWNEADMHRLPSRSDENWTSPLTAAELVHYVFLHSMISSDLTTSQISGILTNCETGQNRIPAPLKDTDALVAHKTGTGFPDASGNPTGINDVAFILLPEGKSYVLAVFVKTTKLDMPQTEKMIADISSLTYRYITTHSTPSQN